jgi:hypothetical protein
MDEAYGMLPPGPWQVKVRSDSAAYQQEVLDHWDSRGWEFAVSADMSRHLGRLLLRIADDILEALLAPARRRIRGIIWDTS